MTQLSSDLFQQQFFKRNPLAESVIRLFDALPQAYFYAKDRQGRFVKVNHLFLENHGLDDESQALGKTDLDFHPPLMAKAYMDEDQRVMQSGQTLPGQVWPVLHRRRWPRWYVSTKTPLFDPQGRVIGIAGAMYRIEAPEELEKFFQELAPVVRHIDEHYADSISMADMAVLATLSSTHFNRRFKQLFRMTPMQYLRTVRVQAVQRLLTTTQRGMADLAALTGFADQSHLIRVFRQVTGMTPAAFRKRFRE
ncbi:AraC family transcriptional regulator [Aeoliella sp. ICT_H6.2]|uniref:AraC family transcriptional regulator n=1 Tax=Aeoliella straminimaris TaxID=2954799 RepID=A0A9X2FIF1_9BACT|nr:AraC family transcriptional regulator [Aeoliella straminimaris]MCO6047764.1 AraC family transcriptional regulator [Aeoliella straminimaris]